MLQTFVIYLLKVSICSGLLLTYYWIALRNKRFHYYNRFYLLMAVVISIIIPFLNLQLFTFNIGNRRAIPLLNVIYSNGEPEANVSNKSLLIHWQQWLATVPLIIAAGLLCLLAYRIIKIYHLKRIYPVSKTGEFDFINTDLQQAPFSFLKNLFWRNDISLEEITGRQILRHELAHIQQKHSWDKLFMQLVVSILWMNPFYWFIRKELNLIHEFIADEKSVSGKNASAFAAMLLHAQYGKFMFTPAQSFFTHL